MDLQRFLLTSGRSWLSLLCNISFIIQRKRLFFKNGEENSSITMKMQNGMEKLQKMAEDRNPTTRTLDDEARRAFEAAGVPFWYARDLRDADFL